jgi:hypothetical protein
MAIWLEFRRLFAIDPSGRKMATLHGRKLGLLIKFVNPESSIPASRPFDGKCLAHAT